MDPKPLDGLRIAAANPADWANVTRLAAGALELGSGQSIGAAALLAAMDAHAERAAVSAAISKFDLDATKAADVLAARAYVWAQNNAPLNYSEVPWSGRNLNPSPSPSWRSNSPDRARSIAVIGSAAKPLWKEIPRFYAFRRAGIEIWHECKDLDLAVWISSQERLGAIRRARDIALRKAYESGEGPSVANHQVDIFLLQPGSDKYLGRLCNFSTCPKDKPECRTPGCGAVPFNKAVDGFTP